MIQVSNEFKKAIKATERRIKGYVEVLYDVKKIDTNNTSEFTSTYTDVSQITDGNRVTKDYGSLDYLPLDGSRLTVTDGIQLNAGYISDELFENIDFPEISLSFQETTLSCFTIYFKDNIATKFRVFFSDNTVKTIINDKSIVQVEFDKPKTTESLSIIIDSMEYEDRKIKIDEIDFGISTIYEGNELIEFTIDEEVNKLVEEVPINECEIVVGNYDDKFNPINPKGIIKYINNNTLIIPHIGVLTENLGIEYVKMGEFFFDSYTNNSDKTTTLVGQNILKQIENETLKDDNEKFTQSSVLTEQNFKNLMSNYPYVFNVLDWSYNPVIFGFNEINLFNMLKDLSFFQSCIFCANRDNKINIKKISNIIRETINKSQLLNDVQYKNIDKINTVEGSRKYFNVSDTTSRNILNETVTLSKPSEIFLFKSDSGDFMFGGALAQTGGTTISKLFYNYYLMFVKVTGNVGAQVNITQTSNKTVSSTDRIYTKTSKKGNENEIKLIFDSSLIYNMESFINDYTTILDIAPSYEISFEYFGDPSLEAGDYINVETLYGYKKLFIQKNRFKFDGGLRGTIEGVE